MVDQHPNDHNNEPKTEQSTPDIEHLKLRIEQGLDQIFSTPGLEAATYADSTMKQMTIPGREEGLGLLGIKRATVAIEKSPAEQTDANVVTVATYSDFSDTPQRSWQVTQFENGYKEWKNAQGRELTMDEIAAEAQNVCKTDEEVVAYIDAYGDTSQNTDVQGGAMTSYDFTVLNRAVLLTAKDAQALSRDLYRPGDS